MKTLIKIVTETESCGLLVQIAGGDDGWKRVEDLTPEELEKAARNHSTSPEVLELLADAVTSLKDSVADDLRAIWARLDAMDGQNGGR